VAEDDRRIKRKASTNRLAAYRRMYRYIFDRISREEPGDSIVSIEQSSKVVLELEEMLRRKRGKLRSEK